MKLTDLITLVSDVTGEDHGVVRVKARALREAGLIKQGGRGRGGAEMGARDVARLLLSLLSSQSTTTDRQIADLEKAKPWSVKWSWHSGFSRTAHENQFPERLPPILQHLGAGQNVTEALECVLSSRAEIIALSIERTQDGEAVTLGFRGVAEDPDEGGTGGCDWWMDFAIPSPSPSKIRVVREVGGPLINEIAEKSLAGAD